MGLGGWGKQIGNNVIPNAKPPAKGGTILMKFHAIKYENIEINISILSTSNRKF